MDLHEQIREHTQMYTHIQMCIQRYKSFVQKLKSVQIHVCFSFCIEYHKKGNPVLTLLIFHFASGSVENWILEESK